MRRTRHCTLGLRRVGAAALVLALAWVAGTGFARAEAPETFIFVQDNRHQRAILTVDVPDGVGATFTLPDRALAVRIDAADPAVGHAADGIGSLTIGLEGPRPDERCGEFRAGLEDGGSTPFWPERGGFARVARGSGPLECVSAWRHDDGRQLQFMHFWNPGCRCWLSLTAVIAQDGFDAFRYASHPFIETIRARNFDFFAHDGRIAALIKRQDPALPPGVRTVSALRDELEAVRGRSERAGIEAEAAGRRLRSGVPARQPSPVAAAPAAERAPATVSGDTMIPGMQEVVDEIKSINSSLDAEIAASGVGGKPFRISDGDRRVLLYLKVADDIRIDPDRADVRDYLHVRIDPESEFAPLGEGISGTVLMVPPGEGRPAACQTPTEADFADSGRLIERRSDAVECFYAWQIDGLETRVAEWSVWVPACPCYASVSITYVPEERSIANYLVQPVIDSLRAQVAAHFADRTGASEMVARRDPTVPPGVYDLNELMIQIGEAQKRSADARRLREELRKKLRAKLAAKTAPRPAAKPAATARKPAPAVPSDTVVFDLQNDTPRQLLLVFTEHRTPGKHSPTGHKWPGGGKAWILPPGARQEYPLRCTPGRNVCYGLEFDEDYKQTSGVYWGVSLDGNEGCQGCCLVCGGKRTAKRLTWDGKRYPPSSSRGGGGAQAAADILSGFLTGIAIGTALAPPASGGGAAPRGPAYRPSGISGGP